MCCNCDSSGSTDGRTPAQQTLRQQCLTNTSQIAPNLMVRLGLLRIRPWCVSRVHKIYYGWHIRYRPLGSSFGSRLDAHLLHISRRLWLSDAQTMSSAGCKTCSLKRELQSCIQGAVNIKSARTFLRWRPGISLGLRCKSADIIRACDQILLLENIFRYRNKCSHSKCCIDCEGDFRSLVRRP